MRAVRFFSSLSPKSFSPKFTGASPWRGFPSAKGAGSEPGQQSPENAPQGEEAEAEREEMPLPGQLLLAQVVAEADREGLEPARLIFREAGLVAAESLPRPQFLVALQRVALRCEADRLNPGQHPEYVKDVIELVFRLATLDGHNVPHFQLAAIFAEVRKGQSLTDGRQLLPAPATTATRAADERAREIREERQRFNDAFRPGGQVWVLNDADAVVGFCRRADIHMSNEPDWRRAAGQSVEVVQAAASNGLVKCRTGFGPDVWFAAAALLPAAPQAEGGADYAVFRPLAEDINRHGMSVKKAFDVLREGRPGITEQHLRQIMDCYSMHEAPEARRRACARAWALARTDANGEISFTEFERLVARARAAAGGGPGLSCSRSPVVGPGAALPPAAASATESLRAGDAVSAHGLVQKRKSERPSSARVEGVSKDSIDVVFTGTGRRQRIPRDWVAPEQEATPDEAEASEALSDAADSSSHNTEPKDSACWGAKPASCTGAAAGDPGLVGLENLGNSCYMSSILQCLAGTVDLVRYFLGSGCMERDLNPDNRLGSEGNVAREFATLLGSLWEGKQQGYCRPMRFKCVVSDAAEQFSGSEQQDAQEFAAYLLDVLHEDLNRVRGRKPAVEFPDLGVLTQDGEERAAAECWSLYLKRDKSIIVDIFQGQLRSQIRCLRCSFLSTKFDSFMYLSLPVVDVAGAPLYTLGECLREFAREERLSGEERWYCPRCRDRVEATKALTLWKLPAVLLVHLKRFRFENGGLGGVTGGSSNWCSGSWYGWSHGAQKLNHKVDFDLEGLDLGQLGALPASSPQKSEPVFDLFALVDHFGSCGYGHYTAVVWHEGAARWHRFDDEVVAPLEAEEVRSDRAYLLFFRRRGDIIRTQTRSAPEAWPHRINSSWPFLRNEQPKQNGRIYL